MKPHQGIALIFLGFISLFWLPSFSASAESTALPMPEGDEAPAYEMLSPESPYRSIENLEPGSILHLRTGLSVSEDKLLDLLSSARVIYVGEAHDSIEDHGVQLKILKGLLARFPGQITVGMEMLRRPSQPILDEWSAGKVDEKAFLKLWYQDWGSDFEYYKALIDFIRENHVPLIALKPSHEMEVKVGMKGLEGLSKNDQKKLPEIKRDDPYHKKALNAVFKGHGPGSEGFGNFYDTMLLWDESMAENAVRFLSAPEGRDKKMLVFAGGFHVGYGFGIPRRVFRRLPVPFQIVLPYAKDFPEEKQMLNVKAPDLPLPLADFVWGVPYRELEAKPVRLGIFMEPFQAGIRVTDVFPDSAADLAGIQRGDLIASFDGQAIHQPFDLIFILQQKKPGDKVKIGLIREGKAIETEASMQRSRHP